MTDEYASKDLMTQLIVDVKTLEAGRTANHEEIAVLRTEFLGNVKSINDKLGLITAGQTPICIQEQGRLKALESKFNTEVTAIREDVARIDAHVTWIWRTVGGALILAIAAEVYKVVISHFASLIHP
jgi:hypothetical protein